MNNNLKGVARKLDSTGRLVIPQEIRDCLNWLNGDSIEFRIEDNSVLLTKHESRCLVCSAEFNLVILGGHKYCKTCISEAIR
jgi:transcriptional pleiotropic regulator of transition state genes